MPWGLITAMGHVGIQTTKLEESVFDTTQLLGLREIRRRVEQENLPIVSEKPRGAGIEDGFSFVGPEGFVFEVYVGMQEDRAGQLSFGPDRYGRFNFHPRDVTGMMRFLQRVLDFRLSDVIGDDFAYFMRCNPDHHGIALVRGQGTLHHHAWQRRASSTWASSATA